MRTTTLAHAFVESIPRDLDPGILYVSIDFRTTMHLCACGCGNEVVLPLRRTAWSLTYDGESVSINPSVGNWTFECRSHYWIRRGSVHWAGNWNDQQVAAGRERTLVERGVISTHADDSQKRTRVREAVAAAGARLGLGRRSRP